MNEEMKYLLCRACGRSHEDFVQGDYLQQSTNSMSPELTYIVKFKDGETKSVTMSDLFVYLHKRINESQS